MVGQRMWFSLVLSPTDNRVLRIKDNTNVADNSCFLNLMTMKLNYGSILPPVDTNLIQSYFVLEKRLWIVKKISELSPSEIIVKQSI